MDKINFTGGFLIRKPSVRMWHNFEAILPKKKAVFQKFNEEGDKFVVVKSSYDEGISDFILQKRLDFKYYPELNLKNRLNPHNVEQAHEIIDAQTNVIDTRKDLKNFFKACKTLIVIPKYKWKQNDHVEQTFKALGLDLSQHKYQIKNGITVIKDKSGKIIAKASPNNVNGTNFVYILPKNTDLSPRKIAVDYKGEIIYEFKGVDSYKDFSKNFIKAVKIDKGRTSSQK